ncbi:hypothetical protein BH10ACT3_BH10ACT3_03930 [soil metagenome]
MSETTNTATTARTNRLGIARRSNARRAGRLLIGTAGAIVLTGAFAGTASALTPPAPQPVMPIAQAPFEPQPPVGPMVLSLPETPGPVLDGPDELAQPLPTPEPHPAPGPQGPGDLVDAPDEPGLPGPDDFTNGEDEPATPDPTVPEADVEVESETVEVADSADAATPDSLAFTGGNLGAVTAGVALLGIGGLAAAGGVASRRRNRAQAEV